jgi:shikimate kinase
VIAIAACALILAPLYNPQMDVEPTGIQRRLSRLILTGFMGAGKSTVGAILAREMGWRFVDLDDVIEASSKRTVAEIFRELGEATFREHERQAVRQLSNQEKIVLALGGGTVEDESTRSLLLHSPENCLVFLQAPLPEMLARCKVEGKVRPLMAAAESLEARHNRRLPYYQTAHVTVETTGLAPQKVANRVLEQVGMQWMIETGKR